MWVTSTDWYEDQCSWEVEDLQAAGSFEPMVKGKKNTLCISYEQHQEISHVIFSAEWQKLSN